MANRDNLNDSPLPTDNNSSRKSKDLLPRFFRSAANAKFLQGTLDQLTQPGVVEKLNDFVGKKYTKSWQPGDTFLNENFANRENYQLGPALVHKNNLDTVDFAKDYIDYLGTTEFFGGNVENQDKLNKQESYAWNPNIDLDKFVNFREYYWLPEGPKSISIIGQTREIESTYTVSTVVDDDNTAYIFNNGKERNPSLKLYRGQTYRFEIDSPGHPIAFALSRTFLPGTAIITAGAEGIKGDGLFGAGLYGNDYDVGDYIVLPSSGSVTFDDDENVSTLYEDGQRKLGEEGEEIANVYVEKGVIEFTIPDNAPDRLFYISKNNQDTSGIFRIYNIEDASFVNVEEEILNKKTYTSGNGVKFSNGMKVKFRGEVTPEKYGTGEWFVDGVGDRISIVSENDLISAATYYTDKDLPFDAEEFDAGALSVALSYPAKKDYIVSNRGSIDRNPWARNNRWFHKDVIEESLRLNHLPVEWDQTSRASRPIIEYEAGLKLYNYGVEAKTDVDLIDTFTKDVFSTIEGQIGYNIDGVDLADGMRVLFTADPDPLVNGKIFQVKFITLDEGQNVRRQISLVETADTNPIDLELVFVTNGTKNIGKTYHYHSDTWLEAQIKTDINQYPLFDLHFENLTDAQLQNFIGTKIFSYKEGSGTVDSELGFPLSYKNITNSGDIEFNFNLLTDTFTIEEENEEPVIQKTDTAFLKKYSDIDTFEYVNGYSNQPVETTQYAVIDYTASNLQKNNFEVSQYDDASTTTDLKVVVYKNHQLQFENVDYELDKINKSVLVRFYKDCEVNDIVSLKAKSSKSKNQKGYYEFPTNFTSNPNNIDVTTFTLGEAIDHVGTILEDLNSYRGTYPGASNLRDLGNYKIYGKRFIKHSSPLSLALYHITNKDYNIIKALDYAENEYIKFKRVFLQTAESLGFDGTPLQHFQKTMEALNIDKMRSAPFYFSDMLSYIGGTEEVFEVLDNRIKEYPLNTPFNLDTLNTKSVYVYYQDKQLVFGRDYHFENTGFVTITREIETGKTLKILEFSNSDGSFIPPTPSKLGLYPTTYPALVLDDSFQLAKADPNKAYQIYAEVAGSQPYDEYSTELNDAQTKEGMIGYHYPVYKNESAAKAADSNSEVIKLYFEGLSYPLYLPKNEAQFEKQVNTSYDVYPEALAFIKGHDGSYVRAYEDFRDYVLLELEKRIHNNIKIKYDQSYFDIDGFLSGAYRKNSFSFEENNASLLQSFTKWLKLVDNDYTDSTFYDRNNQFTFNYSSSLSRDGQQLPGFWRGVYQFLFDTDRPHSHPWEILGFKNKPSWWNLTYGPGPYTRDNLILWEDLQEGIVREPNKEIKIRSQYARPDLLKNIPVDDKGKLASPITSGAAQNFVLRLSNQSFKFGDFAPVENSWRKSSGYAFAVIRSMLVNLPAKTVGTGWDRSRTIRNLANQLVYTETNKPISLNDLVFPNTVTDNVRVSTVGLINYIYNLIASDIVSVYTEYQNQITNLQNNLVLRLGGYSDNNKINVLIDSRSPTVAQTGGIYLPQENYDVIYNKSNPIDVLTYSGLAIQKATDGFIVRGYTDVKPFFEYYPILDDNSNNSITVGGISETSQEWSPNEPYVKGMIVENNNSYYRVTQDFTTPAVFNTDNLAKLPALPITGGKTATISKAFDRTRIQKLSYGSKLKTSQEVVNFILGYESRLKDLGFEFNYVTEDGQVETWRKAIEEFLFWTTQGWANGTVIVLSPAANELTFVPKQTFAVDNLYDPFYDYSIVDSSGQPLDKEFGNLLREGNSFGLTVQDTDAGIYGIVLPMIQHEHIIVFDNITSFGDIIYEPQTGYRQERLKVLGYRSADWDASLNVPGFVFDDAKIVEWETYKDYKIGQLVKYKEYYYVAISNVPGSTEFDSAYYYRLSEKPESQLMTNFDYRINQFNDFYDVDNVGFDSELQKVAQHLIGYQKRSYLSNIIIDDVSQYKFYQGMIQEKGTTNALTKLFDRLNEQTDSLEFYEDWAVQVGRFGSTDTYNQIEINLKQSALKNAPQIVKLTNNVPATNIEQTYYIKETELYDKPAHFDIDNTFIENESVKRTLQTSGYVNEKDIDFIARNKIQLTTGNVNTLSLNDYLWTQGTDLEDWNVWQHIETSAQAISGELLEETNNDDLPLYRITLDTLASVVTKTGDLIALLGANEYRINGIYAVEKTSLKTIDIVLGEGQEPKDFVDEKFRLTKLRSVRYDSVSDVDIFGRNSFYQNQKLWIDSFAGDWKVLKHSSVWSKKQEIANHEPDTGLYENYARHVVADKENRNVFVSANGQDNGKVYFYRRTKENFDLTLDQEIEFTEDYLNYEDAEFGTAIDISPDGEFLAVGLPKASNVKTRFKGDFDENTEYNKNDIVKYRENLWQANRTIFPKVDQQSFSTFDSYTDMISRTDTDSTDLNLLVAGNPGLPSTTVNHFLVRAPIDMYIGTVAGDRINLSWNQRSFAFPTLDNYIPFDGEIPELDAEFLTAEHTIVDKIDHVFLIEAFVALPTVGQRVTTDTGSGEVQYVAISGDSAVIYIKDVNGIFQATGELFVEEEDFVGFYDETATLSTSEAVGGYWYINTGFNYNNGSTQIEKGQGLVYADLRQAGDTDPINDYYNIQNTVAEVGPYVTQRNNASFITHLSYRGDPGGLVEGPQLSRFYLVKLPKDFSDDYYAENFESDEIVADPREYNLRFFDNDSVNIRDKGYTTELLNKAVQAYDLWDGYIDFEFTNFDFIGNPFEPYARYTFEEDGEGNLQVVDRGEGDIIEDIQTPRDGLGGLALTSTSTSTAEVMYFIRQFNTVRVYIKVRSGSWDELNNIGKYEVRRKATATISRPDGTGGPGDVDITMGTVADFDNDVIVEKDPIGKLMVLLADNPFDIVDDPEIKDQEYYFFNESTIATGAARPANAPYTNNKDYKKIYNIPADANGEPGPDNEGAVAIYRRLPQGEYELKTTFVSEYRKEDRMFGSQIKFVQKDNYYTLLIGTAAIPGEGFEADIVGYAERDNPGSLEIFRHGTKPTDFFKGEYKITTYNKGDIVIYKDDYYIANREVDVQTSTITNSIYWTNISWRTGKDDLYQGEWNNEYPYAIDDIVYRDNVLYQAQTNIGAGASFSSSQWSTIDSKIDYVGLLPNRSNLTFYEDETIYDPQSNILKFAETFDVSEDGQVLAVIAKQAFSDSTPNSVLLVYRQYDDKFMLHQTIDAPKTETVFNPYLQKLIESDAYKGYYGVLYPEDSAWNDSVKNNPLTVAYRKGDIVQYRNSYYKAVNDVVIQDAAKWSGFGDSAFAYDSIPFDITEWDIIPKQLRVATDEWGSSLSISPDGDTIAVVAPGDDSHKTNQGVVYVYKLTNGSFVQNQIIRSPNNEESEGFGSAVSLTNDVLAVTSINGDQIVSTTFDAEQTATTFDSEFTVFNNVKLDTGVVNIYEVLDNTFVYSEQLQFKNAQSQFGEVINLNNNHIYAAMPDYQNPEDLNFGIVLDYRRPKLSYAWQTIRNSVNQVDLSKIEGIRLYNKSTNALVSYIDYIDPIQGKIAGPAEQEIKFKLRKDPALYNVGQLSNIRVNTSQYWGPEHVGEIWWDISEVRFVEPYQDLDTWQADNVGKFTDGSSIQLYEWVESRFLPSQWNELSGSDEGVSLGITGSAPFGDSFYSSELRYDQVSQTFSNVYYFWVQDKFTVPAKSFRRLKLSEVKALLEAPRENNYRFINFLNKNTLLLNNFSNLVTNDDLVLQIRWKTFEDSGQNTHSQYQIISEGLVRNGLNVDIERKWFDSLIGVDGNGKKVPDTTIPVNHRYGVQNSPRQSMFVNRNEALKQVIERVNDKLLTVPVVDNYDISNLDGKEDLPAIESNLYDIAVDTILDLDFVSVNKVQQAKFRPVVLNGRIVSVIIEDSGRGYKRPPIIEITGPGTGAEFNVSINNLGQVTSVEIVNDGKDYLDNAQLIARRFSVAVRSDENVFNKWSIYSYNETDKKWFTSLTQEYDTSAFYEKVDWYETGYNQFTKIDHIVDGTYAIDGLDDRIGQIVKVEDIGTGGWTLFEKVANEDTNDYTVNYKTVGRENGTIQFKSTLYNVSESVGFDARSFDSYFFDNIPQTELRFILQTIRDDIFVGDLKEEYNKLFFASVRYAIAEQPGIDWIFKTSFVSATHNLGGLKRTPTFKNDNLDDYEEYINEVKPYSTKIREYISKYTEIEPTNTGVSDFDLPPQYSDNDKKILPSRANVVDGVVLDGESYLNEYPRKFWTDNNGYSVVEIKIKDGGSGYTNKPKVVITGTGTEDAKAEAYLGYGKVTAVKVTYPGKGYKIPPTISFEGGNASGNHATAFAVLGEGVVRQPHILIKFDRTDFDYYYTTLQHTETFTGTQFETRFDLQWEMDVALSKVVVKIDGIEQLRSKYTFENIENTDSGYTRKQGRIIFAKPPALNAAITVEYYKSQNLLKATDRIQFAYDPLENMYGKDVAQLMTGVDYGGVEITSFGFEGVNGWMNDAYFVDSWDQYDNTYEDEVFTADGSTIAVQLSKPLENNVDYNIYKNGIRVDDPHFGTSRQTNENAVCASVRGDGSTSVVYLDEINVEINDGDVLIIRKITSDGSILPDVTSYDTQLQGGDLPYASAKGVNAEEIIVDGDGFVSTKNAGPEEFIPGTVLDTLDIKVYTNKGKGQGRIFSQSYIMDTENEFDLGVVPATIDNVIVKANNIILDPADYTIDYSPTKPKVVLNSSVVVAGQELNIISQEAGVQNIVDFGSFTTDASTTVFDTGITYNEDYTAFVTIQGIEQTFSIFETENGTLSIIPDVVEANKRLDYIIFSNGEQINYSQAKIDRFTGDGTLTRFTLANAPFYAPPGQHNVIVKIDNTILNPGYNIEYTIPENNQREYVLETFQQPAGSNAAEDIKVFINGEEITTPVQWRFDIANSSVILSDEYGVPGDTVEIFVITDGEYQFDGATLILDTPAANGSDISVYQYSNHNIVEIERINYDVIKRSTINPTSLDYQKYNRLTVGEIQLRTKAVDAQYVFVSVNGELLTPSVDFKLTDDRTKVQLVRTPAENDVIDVMHFSSDVSSPKFAFRQFKDILNRTHYKRLDDSVTTLAQPLNLYDLRIYLDDASSLPEPSKEKNVPGVVFIDGERIEYFVKEENMLRQIRRGTLGTGAKAHPAGAEVFDQSIDKTIPYKDVTYTNRFNGDGLTNDFVLEFNVNNINEIEVFVGGQRLRKNSISVYNKELAMDSPDGDETSAAQFTVDADTNTLTLAEVPGENERIIVVKKTLTEWSGLGEQLALADNSIARFLRAGASY